MEALALKRESDNYWNLIKDASNEVKLALIKRLSDALRPAVAEKKAKKKKYGAVQFFRGCSPVTTAEYSTQTIHIS